MICAAENNFEQYSHICKNNPFGCRIMSLYNTYSPQLPFVDYWVQKTDGECAGLISRLEAAFVLCLTEKTDLEEVSSFIRVCGASKIICDAKYELGLESCSNRGYILTKNNRFPLEGNYEVTVPTVREVYSVISRCSSVNFNVPSYDSFALDVSHKLNKKSIRMLGIKNNKQLCSCIMTLAESEDSAVLGALATIPGQRRCGYGTYLIKYLTNILLNEGKTVYLHRAENENVSFYSKLGFSVCGSWKEYSL